MSSHIRSIIVDQCLEILKREDVKEEIKSVIKPMISLLLQEIYPYIFISLLFVLISFLLILGIFVFLLRIKKSVSN
ncbi:hypothetical protein [uncultured Mediterranean phage]|jgi:hypothetical protein|nr:hypothetical protein [uncultured Mediterranean phage]